MIDAVIEAYRLKDQVRTGWRMRGVGDPESVADHSWGTAYLVLLFADEAGIDRAAALEVATVHDLAEAITGDVATRVREMNDAELASAKRAREEAAVHELTRAYTAPAADRVRARWREYEERATPEARFVRDMNLIDMCVQAYRYESDGRYDPDAPNRHFPDYVGLDEFFATTRPRLTTRLGRELFIGLVERYAALPRVAERGGARLTPGGPATGGDAPSRGR
ncbi:MAG: HD domain-containing protein [Spirochaetota bacterium]